MFLIIQFMSMQPGWAASQLAIATLVHLEFTFKEGDQNLQMGTSFGWIFIWSGQTDFGRG